MGILKRLFGGAPDLKQVIIIRTDLKMGKGKMVAQGSHASLMAAEKSPAKKKWVGQGQKKIVLKASSEKELLDLNQQAKDAGLKTALVTDAGHTQIPGGTRTALAIGPAEEEDLDKICGELKLL